MKSWPAKALLLASAAAFVIELPGRARLETLAELWAGAAADSLAGSLWRNDVLLRDPFTAEPVPRTRWSFGVVESTKVARLAALGVAVDVGQLGLLERENAAILNACLRPLARETISAFRQSIADLGITAPPNPRVGGVYSRSRRGCCRRLPTRTVSRRCARRAGASCPGRPRGPAGSTWSSTGSSGSVAARDCG
mgnify:CR=1 FL=1